MNESENFIKKYNEEYSQIIERLQKDAQQSQEKFLEAFSQATDDMNKLEGDEQASVQNNYQEQLKLANELNSLFRQEIGKLEQNLINKLQQAVDTLSKKIEKSNKQV